MLFTFGDYKTEVSISRELPNLQSEENAIVICDENTSYIAGKICGKLPHCTLKSGEENKNWDSVLQILSCAHKASLGRDAFFIAVGGGVIGDLAGFASSIYMRGCPFILVSTTLLGMVDASVGGKTGFDLFGIKNLIGTFYPAFKVFIPIDSLASLPAHEWKSGMAELIKTAILSGDGFLDELIQLTKNLHLIQGSSAAFPDTNKLLKNPVLQECIKKAVCYKGSLASEDPKETGPRMLLNLGHTFGHALEAALGLGKISHGEAVAWGMVRAAELGLELGITPRERAEKITALIKLFGYNYSLDLLNNCGSGAEKFMNALKSDKKKKKDSLRFIVPDAQSAQIVTLNKNEIDIIKQIITGEQPNK